MLFFFVDDKKIELRNQHNKTNNPKTHKPKSIEKMDNLLEKIDGIKQKITDQEYRDLMDNLSEVNDTKNTQYEVILVVLRPSTYLCVSVGKIEYVLGYKKLRPSKIINQDLLHKYLEETEKDGLISCCVPCKYVPRDNVLTLHQADIFIFDAESDEDYEDYRGKTIEIQRYGMISIKKI